MAKGKNKGKNPAGQPPTPISPAAAAPPSTGPTTFTPEQLEAARQQAAQRLRVEHATLKVQFADAAVALAIATQERDQLIQRVQASQKIIEQLSIELEALKQAATDDAAVSGPQPDPDDDALVPDPTPDCKPVTEPDPQPEEA